MSKSIPRDFQHEPPPIHLLLFAGGKRDRLSGTLRAQPRRLSPNEKLNIAQWAAAVKARAIFSVVRARTLSLCAM